MFLRFKLFNWLYVYINSRPMRTRNKRDLESRGWYNVHKWKKEVKYPLEKRALGHCELCGRQSERMEGHHVLPYAQFPELDRNIDNLMLLCHWCHHRIHTNPFMNIRLMRQKADVFGVNVEERFTNSEHKAKTS